MVACAQSGCHCLFHNGLTGRHAVQGGIQAEAFDGKSTVGRDEFFPGKGFGSLKKVFKRMGWEGAQRNQDPFSCPKPEVQPGNVLHGTLAEDPAVLSPNLLHVHAPELVRCQALYPKKGWNDKGELIHNFDPLYPDNNA